MPEKLHDSRSSRNFSLSSHSDDERAARDYLLSNEAGLVVNIVDASNLERNLFLTLSLIEMRVPLIVVLNMMDLAEKRHQNRSFCLVCIPRRSGYGDKRR